MIVEFCYFVLLAYMYATLSPLQEFKLSHDLVTHHDLELFGQKTIRIRNVYILNFKLLNGWWGRGGEGGGSARFSKVRVNIFC